MNASTAVITTTGTGFAAIFIDYENVYYHLRKRFADIPELGDFVIDLLMSLQRHLEEKFNVRSIISKAYADYERIKSTPQGSLYLMGVETVYVLGTEHKNAADMRLCIDAMEVLYTRPEIQTFVIFAGDRDYIPLIQHLKKLAKNVVAVGFEGSFSGDLMLNVGRPNFIDGIELFAPERLSKLEEAAKRYQDYTRAEQERKEQRERELREREARKAMAESVEKDEKPETDAANIATAENVEQDATQTATQFVITEFDPDAKTPPSESEDAKHSEKGKKDRGSKSAWRDNANPFNPVIPELTETERICLETLLRNYRTHHEIYLTPFLRKLPDALPNLADWERKNIVSDLEFKGALRLEKRTGVPFDYTIVLLNYNHPVVRELY